MSSMRQDGSPYQEDNGQAGPWATLHEVQPLLNPRRNDIGYGLVSILHPVLGSYPGDQISPNDPI